MYSFERLIHKDLSKEDNPTSIFNKAETIIDSSSEPIEIKDLEDILNQEDYYVLHDYVIYKGKQKVFKGKVVKAHRNHILEYLKKCKEQDDFRPILILPQDLNEWVISISDEGVEVLFKLKS